MANIIRDDESLAERDEVVFPNTDMIDTEPFYSNFTAIQKSLQENEQNKQIDVTSHQTSHSSDDLHRATCVKVETSSVHHSNSNEMLNNQTQNSWKSSTVPINIQSKRIDGHIFNLTKIVEDIGYDRNTPFMRPSSDSNTKNVSALLDIVLKMGGAQGPLVNVWRSRIDNNYFQRWYLEKYFQRSASSTQHNNIHIKNDNAMQNGQARDYRSNIVIDNLVLNKQATQQSANEQYYENVIRKMYGYDDVDAASPTSSHSSTFELESINNPYLNQNNSSVMTSVIKKPTNNNGNIYENSPIQRHVTIVDNQPASQLNKTLSSQEETNATNQRILQEYRQFIKSHPDLHNDPNPQIVTKPNRDPISYKQNISVRYLSPPTPPPPGPLIIREVVPARAPSPPPLVIQYQEPSPPTPPPLILREAPPPPPPKQEAKVITKYLPPHPPSTRRVIIERNPPPPPKPQDIIIEKWLPYKAAPQPEVIFERVSEESPMAEFEPAGLQVQKQRRHSAEYVSDSASLQVPVEYQRRNSLNFLEQAYISQQPSGTFDELAWRTHQQVLAMQQRGREQVQAHQQWAANLWQQHSNMFLHYPQQLTTPSLVVYHPPTTMNSASYVETQEYRQQIQYNPTIVYPFM